MSTLTSIIDSVGGEVNSPTRNALATFATWEYSIPLTSQWIVRIEPILPATTPILLQNIGLGTSFDRTYWQIPIGIQSILFNNQVNNDVVGTYFARKVIVPGEEFDINTAAPSNMYGFLQGTVGGERTEVRGKQFEIDFIGTNLDFVETVIRPWIITGSYAGLLARNPEDSIKCNITIVRFTRGLLLVNPRPMTIMYNFFNCLPIHMPTESLSYSEGEKDIHKTIQWTFTNYTTQVFSFLNQG